MFDGANEIGHAVILDIAGTLDARAAHLQEGGGLALGSCIHGCTLLVVAITQRRQVSRDHGPLAGVKMPTMQVSRRNERVRIRRKLFPKARIDVLQAAGPITVAAVENLPPVKDDWLPVALLPHLLSSLVSLSVRH